MTTTSHPWFSLAPATLLVIVLLASACAPVSSVAPIPVSLAQLAADDGTYDGRDIETQGIVRQFQDPAGTLYYTIEDSRPNRVNLTPANVADMYVGERVEVNGTFHFDEYKGRFITVQRVRPFRDGAA
jgi:hypothetical protein